MLCCGKQEARGSELLSAFGITAYLRVRVVLWTKDRCTFGFFSSEGRPYSARGVYSLALLLILLLPLSAHAAPLPLADVRPPVVTPEMKRYSEIGYTLYFAGTAYGLLTLWAVLATGLSARLRRWVQPLRFSFLRLLAYYTLLTLVLVIIHAPLTIYRGYVLPHQYGLSSQSAGGWLGDIGKSVGIDIATTVPLLWLLFWLIKHSPRRWALWFWAALVPIIAFGIFAAPLVVDPLFNHFMPLPPGPLRVQIEALATKAGIPNAPIYVVDKSKQTHETNAYVTGIGSSARIVLWDTILPPRMPQDQLRAIVGHEMGHYVLKHLYWGFLLTVLGLLLALPAAQKFAESLLRRFGSRWRVDGPADYAAVPVLLLTVSLFSFLFAPVTNGVSREVEHQADAYGLKITGNGPAMARGFVTISEQNLSDPSPPPFVKFWLFTHPPLQERIDFALGKKADK